MILFTRDVPGPEPPTCIASCNNASRHPQLHPRHYTASGAKELQMAYQALGTTAEVLRGEGGKNSGDGVFDSDERTPHTENTYQLVVTPLFFLVSEDESVSSDAFLNSILLLACIRAQQRRRLERACCDVRCSEGRRVARHSLCVCYALQTLQRKHNEKKKKQKRKGKTKRRET